MILAPSGNQYADETAFPLSQWRRSSVMSEKPLFAWLNLLEIMNTANLSPGRDH